MKAVALRIGDVVPCPGPVDRELVRAVKSRRGRLHGSAASESTTAGAHSARAILNSHDEAATRRASPLEQAKAHIRSRGWKVFNADVIGGPAGSFVIGTKLHSERSLFAFARRHGWQRRDGR